MKRLDLHRTTHSEVRPKVIRFVEEHWGLVEEAEIITGNSQRMKDIVTGVLDEYQMRYQVGRMFDLNNQGYIVTWFD